MWDFAETLSSLGEPRPQPSISQPPCLPHAPFLPSSTGLTGDIYLDNNPLRKFKIYSLDMQPKFLNRWVPDHASRWLFKDGKLSEPERSPENTQTSPLVCTSETETQNNGGNDLSFLVVWAVIMPPPQLGLLSHYWVVDPRWAVLEGTPLRSHSCYQEVVIFLLVDSPLETSLTSGDQPCSSLKALASSLLS